MMNYCSSKQLLYNYFSNMINTSPIPEYKLPVLKFTVVLMIVISILFPSIFAYINHEKKVWVLLKDIFITGVSFTIMAVFVYAILQLQHIQQVKRVSYWVRQVTELLLVTVSGFCFLYAAYMITRQVYKSPALLLQYMPFRFFISVNMVGVLFVYLLEKSLILYQLMLVKYAQTEKLQQQYSEVRLQALKNQVNPHFLFNSLSVLSSLVHTDAETAERFIIQLSKAYRYILEQKDAALVTLKEELNFSDAYFFLLQIRFGEKVNLKRTISIDTEAYQLPPLTLQLLVENAVKHNKMSMAEPLLIEITAGDKKIVVRNNYNPREKEERSTGIGLENITERVAYVTNEPVVIKQEKGWFAVTIPLHKKS